MASTAAIARKAAKGRKNTAGCWYAVRAWDQETGEGVAMENELQRETVVPFIMATTRGAARGQTLTFDVHQWSGLSLRPVARYAWKKTLGLTIIRGEDFRTLRVVRENDGKVFEVASAKSAAASSRAPKKASPATTAKHRACAGTDPCCGCALSCETCHGPNMTHGSWHADHARVNARIKSRTPATSTRSRGCTPSGSRTPSVPYPSTRRSSRRSSASSSSAPKKSQKASARKPELLELVRRGGTLVRETINCGKCPKEHGPYFYFYFVDGDGRRHKRYVGKKLPDDVRAARVEALLRKWWHPDAKRELEELGEKPGQRR